MEAKRLIIFLLIIVALLILGYTLQPRSTGKSVADASAKTETAFVTRVVDGDTIHVDINGKEEIVRMLGINTPEKKKPYYPEAKDFLIDNIENKNVELLVDKEDIDRYGRKLRYVFYENRLINVEIVENGFATTFMLDELSFSDKFVSAEKFAREYEKGLWKKSNDKCSKCILFVSLNAVEDYFIIKNTCDFYCNLVNWSVKDDANHFFKLNSLKAGEEERYDTKKYLKLKEVWNDNGDRFFMRDSIGGLVIFYEYFS